MKRGGLRGALWEWQKGPDARLSPGCPVFRRCKCAPMGLTYRTNGICSVENWHLYTACTRGSAAAAVCLLEGRAQES
eukprot:134856-Chlamydomonas_euryale.AAC.3